MTYKIDEMIYGFILSIGIYREICKNVPMTVSVKLRWSTLCKFLDYPEHFLEPQDVQ